MTIASPLSTLSLQMRGTLLVALSGMLFGLMGYLGTKILAYDLSIENMLFWRFLVATIWILAATFLNKKTVFQKNDNTISLLKIFALGALSYSGGSAFYFLASQHIGTGLAMVVFFSFPVFVTLFTWLLDGWQLNKYALGSLVAVILGLIFLKGKGTGSVDLTGLFFGIIAAISYATYVYGSQHTTKNIDSRLLTLLVCAGNTLIFLGISYYTNTLVMPTDGIIWLYIFALGILATVLPIQLLLDGLKYISPIKASILSVLEPVVTVLIGIILLGESISYIQSLGVLIVLLGAILIQFEKPHRDESNI